MSDWRPTAPIAALRRRAEILSSIRAFFAARGVLEVETPLLSAATVTDVHLHSLAATTADGGRRYLQTSPEFHMKRLLAAGSGPIFQLGRAVRDGESGRRHNLEFTMLEWYRPGFGHQRLMNEIDELLGEILGTPHAERLTYRGAFLRHAGVDPFAAPIEELRSAVLRSGVADPGLDDRDGLLSLLVGAVVEPRLGRGRPSFLYDYPASQAALARIRPGDPPVAERFEVYVDGVELANGFHELTDAAEQRARFEADLADRRRSGLEEPPVDERLLAALAAGLPDCAGVALGVDRLVMIALGAADIAEVIAFPADRA